MAEDTTEGGPPPESEKKGEGAVGNVVSLEEVRAREAEGAAGQEGEGGERRPVQAPPRGERPAQPPQGAAGAAATGGLTREEFEQGIIDARNKLADARRENAALADRNTQANANLEDARHRLHWSLALAAVTLIVGIGGAIYLGSQLGKAERREATLKSDLEQAERDLTVEKSASQAAEKSSEQWKADYEFVKGNYDLVVGEFGLGADKNDQAKVVEAAKAAAAAKKAQDEAVAQAAQAAAAASATLAETPKPAEGTAAPATPAAAPEAPKQTTVAAIKPCVEGMRALGFTEADAKQGCGL